MSFFARLEATCAGAVERTFALAFPSALEPVQIARKLVAAYESGLEARGRNGRRFVVQLSAADYARLEADRTYLESQWASMLARLAERAGRPERMPQVCTEVGSGVATGTVAIVVEPLAEPARLLLRVRRGVPPDAAVLLAGVVAVGRDPASDLVLVDPRVSRRHCTIEVTATGMTFLDLGSSNGTSLNGVRRAEGALRLGDVLVLGDCELVVEAVPTGDAT